MNFIWVFIGGGAGSALRYAIGLLVQRITNSLTLATFISNVTACVLFAGTLYLIQQKELAAANLRLLILTGFCGGLSTFSTFGYETFLLFSRGQVLYAVLNSMLSLLLCTLIFYCIKFNSN
jgi:CrcB protein